MADETNYPRVREDNLSMLTLDNVQGYEQGRPDVIARRTMGSSRMCKVFCAVNHIRNPLPCRDSVRIFEESVYNELYMKGYRGEQLETEYKKMLAERYASFDSGLGKKFENGEMTLEEAYEYGKKVGEPKQTSGKQELYEAIVAMYC